jgi:hypothetical protein
MNPLTGRDSPAARPPRAKTAAHPPGVMCGEALQAETDQAERESGTARRKAFTPYRRG